MEVSPSECQLMKVGLCLLTCMFCLFFIQEECQNYVRVLIVYGKKVFTCGTNAFSPVCSSRQVNYALPLLGKIRVGWKWIVGEQHGFERVI